jgi:hypothetical protein
MTISKQYGRVSVTTNPVNPAKAAAIAKLKSRAIQGTASGIGLATGVAAAEVAIPLAATAAETVVVAVEAIAIVPTVLTLAALAGTGVLGYLGAKRLQEWWRSPVA